MKKLSIVVMFLAALTIMGCVNQQNLNIDSDKDGVFDKYDKCPNTPFNKLVDKDGCPIK